MPNPEMQSLVFNAATVTGPSTALNVSKESYQWWVLTVHAANAQVQLEFSETGVEGSFVPAVAQPGTVNPLSLFYASGYIAAFGTTQYVRANILNIAYGSVTAVLQGYPWNYLNTPVSVQSLVGTPITPYAAGAVIQPRLGYYGEQYVSQLGGKYYAAVKAGQVFTAALQGTQALSVNSTTATGIILTNPEGSPVNLEVLSIQVAIASLPAGQFTLILTGQPARTTAPVPVTHTTKLPVRNALLGNQAVGYGLADSAATLPAALIQYVIGAGGAATLAASTSFPPLIKDDVDGLLVLGPGTCTSLQALTTAVTVVGHITWREVAI